jgi:hypothetical protein
MEHFAHTLINWVALNKDALLALVGGAAGLSILAQGLLHRFKVKWSIDSKAFSYALVQVLVVAATASAYLVNNANVLTVYPWLATIAAVIHRYAVSPYYTKKVLPYLEFQASKQPAIQSQPATPEAPVAPAAPSFVG